MLKLLAYALSIMSMACRGLSTRCAKILNFRHAFGENSTTPVRKVGYTSVSKTHLS